VTGFQMNGMSDQITPRVPNVGEPWLVLAGRYLGVVPAGDMTGLDVPAAVVGDGLQTHFFHHEVGVVLQYLSSPAPISEIPVWFAHALNTHPIPILDALEEKKLLASFDPVPSWERRLSQFDDVTFVPSLSVSPGRLSETIRVAPVRPLPDVPLSPYLMDIHRSVESVLLGDGNETIKVLLERGASSTGAHLSVPCASFSLMLVDLLAHGCGFMRRI
jgi:hypothetical protein